jgi:hypothetical protein
VREKEKLEREIFFYLPVEMSFVLRNNCNGENIIIQQLMVKRRRRFEDEVFYRKKQKKNKTFEAPQPFSKVSTEM